MSLIVEVAKELLGMFLADGVLTIATLILVAIVACLIVGLHVDPLVGGGLLFVGSLLTVVGAVVREARRQGAS